MRGKTLSLYRRTNKGREQLLVKLFSGTHHETQVGCALLCMRALADLQPVLRALACEFELASLAPQPRLISAILEYAILAGSLLSP